MGSALREGGASDGRVHLGADAAAWASRPAATAATADGPADPLLPEPQTPPSLEEKSRVARRLPAGGSEVDVVDGPAVVGELAARTDLCDSSRGSWLFPRGGD